MILKCQKCGCEMSGYPGDDICWDCSIGFDRKAFEKAFEESMFQLTGERKTTSEICRSIIGVE